jgi:hypothetical protein
MSTATPTPAPSLVLPARVVVEAVTVYETAAVRAAELAAKAMRGADLAALDVRSWEFAEELKAGALATLTAAGLSHLVEAS